jgi:large subunit ribosomal protein L13
MKTTVAKESEISRKWYIVDATGKPAGRLAVKIADALRGRKKVTYTPHVDQGDFVVVVNAEKVKLTGDKEQKKLYKSYSGYPGGLTTMTAAQVRARKPDFIIEHAVKNMLPKNKLSRQIVTRLKVYAGPDHPHAAQKPEVLKV